MTVSDCSSDSDLEGAVVEVIDHHHLEREPSTSCCVTVETVGSCATLITERIVQEAPEILTLQLAQLLYGEREREEGLPLPAHPSFPNNTVYRW